MSTSPWGLHTQLSSSPEAGPDGLHSHVGEQERGRGDEREREGVVDVSVGMSMPYPSSEGMYLWLFFRSECGSYATGLCWRSFARSLNVWARRMEGGGDGGGLERERKWRRSKR